MSAEPPYVFVTSLPLVSLFDFSLVKFAPSFHDNERFSVTVWSEPDDFISTSTSMPTIVAVDGMLNPKSDVCPEAPNERHAAPHSAYELFEEFIAAAVKLVQLAAVSIVVAT